MNGPIPFVRDVLRDLRRVPGLRRAIEWTDPRRRARRLSSSGLVDPALYGLQSNRPGIDAYTSAADYLDSGHRQGLYLNPLIDELTIRRNLRSPHHPAVYDYLWRRAWHLPVSPWWNSIEYARTHPESLTHPSGPVGHLLARAAADPTTPLTLRSGDDEYVLEWAEFRAEFERILAPWAAAGPLRSAGSRDRLFDGVPTLGQWPAHVAPPLVSIVLPTWNRVGLLRGAIESVQQQTWTNWELLIVDDGSWDDTAIVAEVMAARDPRIRYLPRAHQGVSAARNSGIAEARGEFVTFIDSDNTWLPTFLSEMMIGIRERHDVGAYSTLASANEKGVTYLQSQATPEILAVRNVIDLNTLVVRRDALAQIGGFDTELQRAVDYDLVLRLIQLGSIRHLPILGVQYDNTNLSADRISNTQPLGWNNAVRVKNSISWEAEAERERAPGTDFVFLLHSNDPHIDEKIATAEELAEDDATDVHLVLIAPAPGDWIRGSIATRAARLHTHLFVGREAFAYLVDVMTTRAIHDRIVFIESAVFYDADSFRALATRVDPLRRRVIAPVVRHRDGTSVTVGAAFPRPDSEPIDILSRHPIEDAQALGQDATVPALAGKTFAIPTHDLIRAKGMNTLLYNEFDLASLSLRLQREFGEYESVTATDVHLWRMDLRTDFERRDPTGSSRAIRAEFADFPPTDFNALYAPLDFTVQHFRAVPDGPTRIAPGTRPPRRHLHPVVVRNRRVARVGGCDVPRLRWALRIAAPAGPTGEVWGDTHFARALAKALRMLGQEVVLDYHEDLGRPTQYLDDVTLVLRGLDTIAPSAAGLSLLWVISHPDEVTREEASRFDAVFAASYSWAAESAQQWDIPVQPLLQCTDAELFTPQGLARTEDIVFVGKSRGVPRVAAVAPIRAGVPVRLFGPEWEGILPPGAIEGEYFPNAELPALYESAALVLNDHWSDMQRTGFISNRIFDVVAAGGRVLTDEVPGLATIFGDAVQTFSDGADLVSKLTDAEFTNSFADGPELAEISARIRTEHSFLARAQVLLDTALTRLD